MATVPVEIIKISNSFENDLSSAIALANSIQKEFSYSYMSEGQIAELKMYAFEKTKTSDYLDAVEKFRQAKRGFHPYLISITDSFLEGNIYSNLFGNHRGKKGIAIVTVANVPDVVIPRDKMVAYFLYYFARYSLSFIAPDHKNHEETRNCVFDRKVIKQDLLKSMRARALCDDCRRRLVEEPGSMSPQQFSALEKIFTLAGNIVIDEDEKGGHLKAFIGSSSEGLNVAYKIQELLSDDLSIEIWNQGTVFGLGDSTLEALEAAVLQYQIGIFVFSPDDQIQVRGETKHVARDNVLFELGLFIGKLGRHRTFVVNPGKNAISLPSDLHGITTATFDPDQKDLSIALEPACAQIRKALGNS